jgi:hypothetical protein
MIATGTDRSNSETVSTVWAARAGELAEWAWGRLVNRTDAWGGYNAVADRDKLLPGGSPLGATTTRPPKKQRGKVFLTREVLQRHFAATRPEHVMGLHTTSPENTSRWGAAEIDWHGPDSTAPEVNLAAALGWHGALRAQGFHPLLTESNGLGGYHLGVLLAEPVPTDRMYWFLKQLVADHARHGLPSAPEQFPKQSQIAAGKYGNWLRVPGRHHTRPFWSRAWDGERWLEGHGAIDFMLALTGDPVALIPADSRIRYRVQCYLDKLPNLAEGQGRDDVAYNFAAFLVRDLQLPDAEALEWLERWDAGNRPPKGANRLREIMANAHTYGQRGYGCGRTGTGPSADGSGATAAAGGGTTSSGYDIILAHFREKYQPVFRRGNVLYSGSLNREVRMGEACCAPGKVLVGRLADAADRPRMTDGAVKWTALPQFFRNWAPSAWVDLLDGLRDEEEAEEVSSVAQEQFRDLVAAALLHRESFSYTPRNREGDDRDIQRRTLIDWCQIWGKPGNWQSVRGLSLWTRKDEAGRLCIALNKRLFAQIGKHDLARMTQNSFGGLAEMYEVGTRQRACGSRAVELSHRFVAELLALPAAVDGMADRPGTHAGARENDGKNVNGEAKT